MSWLPLSPWTWLAAAAVLAGLEIVSPGAFMIWLAGAAVGSALVAAVFDPAWEAQLMVFVGLSLISVSTPSRKNGSLDLSYLTRVCEQIGEALKDKDGYHIVVVRSTVLPGTTHGTVIPTLERCSGKTYGEGFGVSVNPEFLREGVALHDVRNPPVTVVGGGAQHRPRAPRVRRSPTLRAPRCVAQDLLR